MRHGQNRDSCQFMIGWAVEYVCLRGDFMNLLLHGIESFLDFLFLNFNSIFWEEDGVLLLHKFSEMLQNSTFAELWIKKQF